MNMDVSPLIEELTWDDIRDTVRELAPTLFQAIERISPDNSYKLYRCRYPYGAKIINAHGIFNIVTRDGKILELDKPEIPEPLKEELIDNRNSIPSFLITKGLVEIFMEDKHHNIESFNVFEAGALIADRDFLNLNPHSLHQSTRQMTSGARTPYMLASLSDTTSFNRLKKEFNLLCQKPIKQTEHWQLFTALANSSACNETWETELILFSKKWFEQKDDAWAPFRLALLEHTWKLLGYIRHLKPLNRIWREFVSKISNKKVNDYILELSRHVLEASFGYEISHTPNYTNGCTGPFNTLSKIIIDVYGLKQYAPIIMQPQQSKNTQEGFVSIKLPSAQFNKSSASRKDENLISNLREIKYTINQFMKKITNYEIAVFDTPLHNLSQMHYDFYHSEMDKYGELALSEHALCDSHIMKYWSEHPTNNKLSFRNEFMRSCVKFSRRK